MSKSSMAILTDATLCIGCEECVQACQKTNGLPEEKPWRWIRNIRDLSSSRWTTIMRVRHDNELSYVRRQCRHCLEPACVEACIVGALQKTPEGPVIYDKDICIGCRYCMIACPWEIPRYSWEDTVPYVQKCTMCYDNIKSGKLDQPACTKACPTKATIFGTRDELLAEAQKRIAANPEKYNEKIFGEHEVGGTNVLYLAPKGVELKLSDTVTAIVDDTPMPERTFEVLHKMPTVFVGMAVAMGGLYWICERREKLSGENSAEAKPEDAADADKPDTDSK